MVGCSFALLNPILETGIAIGHYVGLDEYRSYQFRDSFGLATGNRKRDGLHAAVETLTFIFLYCKVSTLNPIVGIVCTASSLSFCSLYRIVVFPALSRPRIKIRTSFDPKRLSNILLIRIPMVPDKLFRRLPCAESWLTFLSGPLGTLERLYGSANVDLLLYFAFCQSSTGLAVALCPRVRVGAGHKSSHFCVLG